jgi:hypothetical protein
LRFEYENFGGLKLLPQKKMVNGLLLLINRINFVKDVLSANDSVKAFQKNPLQEQMSRFNLFMRMFVGQLSHLHLVKTVTSSFSLMTLVEKLWSIF